MSAVPSLLADALGYSSRGISCIPIKGKKPVRKWKEFQGRRPSNDELRRNFSSRGVTGVAVISGAVSGDLAIRDFDTPTSYDHFKDVHPALARTLPTVRTTRGFHAYFRSNREEIIKLGDGEFRGAGCTIAPHSQGANGVYEWVIPLPPGQLPEVDSSIFIQGSGYTEKQRLQRNREAENTEKQKAILSASLSISASLYTPSEIIQRTQPEGEGQRNACVMKLARGLKFNCGLQDADRAVLLAIVRQWHQLALPIIGTKPFEVTWMDFLHAYEQARYPLEMDILDAAALRVDPNDLPEVASNYEGQTVRQLIGLCWSLASAHPKQHFFLSCHVAAARMNTSAMTIWKIMRMLCADGVIQCTAVGNEHRASRYRWIGGVK